MFLAALRMPSQAERGLQLLVRWLYKVLEGPGAEGDPDWSGDQGNTSGELARPLETPAPTHGWLKISHKTSFHFRTHCNH